jgi:hypothetical protein
MKTTIPAKEAAITKQDSNSKSALKWISSYTNKDLQKSGLTGNAISAKS